MKTYLILIIALLIVPLFTHANGLNIWGHVTDTDTGDPIINQEVVITIDSSASGNYNYYNIVYTNDQGYYSDSIALPDEESGQISVYTFSCGIMLDTIAFFTPDTQTFEFNFEICSNSGGNNCQAYFEYLEGEQPLSIQFIDLSIGWPSEWHWDFGDGTTSTLQNPLHFYPQEGLYTTNLTIVGDSCFSEYELSIIVEIDSTGNCVANYTYNQSSAPNTIEFIDLSTGNVSSWLWDFGDGDISTLQNPVHAYENEGTYYVSLFIQTIDSCFSYFGNYVLVENDTVYCNAEFNVVLDTLNSEPRTYIFTDMSEGEIASWYWEFGDGNFSYDQNPVHSYIESGDYEVCLTITSNPQGTICTSVECKTISTLEYYNFGGQVFIGNYPINIDSTDNSNTATAYLYRKINNSWEFMDKKDFWKYGYYWFSEKPVGEYLIKTELKENAVDYFNYAPSYYNNSTSWKNATVFTLTDNQQFAVNISFQELASLFSGIGNISGMVVGGPSCYTLQNIDTDHVLIQLFNNTGELINYTFSDEDGKYEFTGLGMGDYILKPEYTGRYTDEVNINISNTNPSVTGIDLMVYCSHILDVNELIYENQFQVNLPYPDPANDFVKMQVNSHLNTHGSVSIYSINGNVVFNQSIEIKEGSQIISSNTSTLQSGMYYIKVSLDKVNFSKTYKLVVIH